MDFFSHATDRQQLKEVAATDLRVGMYVILNCSWFVHPFPTKNFQLSTKAQIQTIRGLGLKTVTVDLTKSDPAVVKDLNGNGAPSTTSPAPSSAPAGTSKDTPAAEAGETPSASPAPPQVNPLESYLKGLHEADRALSRHLQNSARFVKDISGGTPEGFQQTKQIVGDLGTMLNSGGSVGAILSALNPEEIEEVSALHALNVCAVSMIVGKHFQLETDKLRALGIGALLHDAGEGKLPVTIRKAHGDLSGEQRRQFEEHPFLSVKLAAKDPGFPALGFTVMQEHHERLDGSGYPFGLKANKLSFLSQIVMVVDEYDEMINPRDPSKAIAPSEALAILTTQRQTQLSKEVVTALTEILGTYPPGSIVRLSDGSMALVLSLGEQDRMRPLVVIHDPTGTSAEPRIVDLSVEQSLSITGLVPKKDVPSGARDLNFKFCSAYFIRGIHETAQQLQEELPKAA